MSRIRRALIVPYVPVGAVVYFGIAALLVLTATACYRRATPAQIPASMSDVYAQLQAKCGDDRQTLMRSLEVNAKRVRDQKGMDMSADLLAMVLNNQLPPAQRQTTCVPDIEALPSQIMR